MNKLNDTISASVIIGIIGNLFSIPIVLFVTSIGINIRLPWNDMASLFFKPPEVYTIWAQIYGFLATFGVSIVNCLIIGGLLKFTGRDFAYLKSIVVCSANVMFAFMILYPTFGLNANQYSITTTFFALFANEIYAILVTYLFLHKTNIGVRM